MKQKLLILFLLFSTVFAGAQSLNREVRKLATEITQSYLDNHDDLLIKPRIGISDFREETSGAEKNSVGTLAAILLTDEFSRSAVFSVIERKSLDELMKEYKLNLSGLIDETTVPEIGKLQGVEFLLVGSVSEVGNKYFITARLVDVESGLVAGSSGIEISAYEIEQESERYIASTFQSPYGIFITPGITTSIELSKSLNALLITSVDLGYRLNKWFVLSLGYAQINSSEINGIDKDKITVDTNETLPVPYNNISRYFRFTGDGIKLAASANIFPSVRFNLGVQVAAVVYFNPILEQDFTEFPVWQAGTGGVQEIVYKRIIVEGFNHDIYASYHILFNANYLISSRLSLFGSLGGYFLPSFTPTSFSSAANVQDDTIETDGDIDRNGIFSQYQNYNFSRNSSGERISFSSMGLSIQLGLAVNF